MSLLESMRQGTQSTGMKVVLGVIVLVFVFWGVGGKSGNGPTNATYAEVNGQRITDSAFQREWRNLARDQMGSLSDDETRELQRRVLDRLIARELMVQEAQRIGLEVSDDEIAEQVLEIDAFKDSKGKFSDKLFTKNLKRMGLSKSRYLEMLRRDLLVGKVMEVALSSVRMSDDQLRAQYDAAVTQVDVTYVRVPEAALLDDVPVDEAAIDALLATNEAQVKASYDADLARLYSTPRKASFSAILLRSDIAGVEAEALKAQAETLRAQAAGLDAAGFADLARTWSEDLSAVNGGNMGTMTEAQMDPVLAGAVFAAAPGAVTPVVETSRGQWVLRVDQIIEATTTPFEDVKRKIARDMVAKDSVAQTTRDYAERVLAAWKAGEAPPQDLLAEQDLSTRSTGAMPLGFLQFPELGEVADLLAAVKAAQAPGVLPGVYPALGGVVVAAVTTYTPADPAQFEQSKDQIRQALLGRAQNEFLVAWQGDLERRASVIRNLQL